MSAKLKDILAVLGKPVAKGLTDIVIEGITHDSRKVRPGCVFVAMKGEVTDGHEYIKDAIENGASAIIAETKPLKDSAVTWIKVRDSKIALGRAAAAVYGWPSNKLTLTGVTGTNGKTTFTYLLESIIKAAGGIPGVIGTISYRWKDNETAASHTTPEASDLQSIMAQMAQDGVTHCIIEVSSHGLHRSRLEGCNFDLGVFTNLTLDHLDYHGDLEEYYQAKKLLFGKLLRHSSKSGLAITNLDDLFGRRLFKEITLVPKIAYGDDFKTAHVRPMDIEITEAGIRGTIGALAARVDIDSKLTGEFNLSNILSAVSAACAIGITPKAISEGINAVENVPGRLERVESLIGSIFVDYAHTPNALRNVLETLKDLAPKRLITLMGCGGDRDKSKRPIMGAEAADLSDFVIVTSDNPRSEDPGAIIKDVEKGILDCDFTRLKSKKQNIEPNRYILIPDRREAVEWAVKRFKPGDILLLAGKGHETYQEIKAVRHPFDDRQVVREELSKLGLLPKKENRA
jgi:UDP-N-acetylmuramoyl-L-alanyl-D-glutamate--2,6-diaminopimelate ligase